MKKEISSPPNQWKRRYFLRTLLQGSLGIVALTLPLPYTSKSVASAQGIIAPGLLLNGLWKILRPIPQLVERYPRIILGAGEVAIDRYVQSQQLRDYELKTLQSSNSEERRLQLLEEALKQRREIATQQIQVIQEWQQKQLEIKLKEIQANWDQKNWAGILSRHETEKLLSQTHNGLLFLLAPPDISPDCSSSIRNNLQYDLVELSPFLAQYYPQTDPNYPVKFYDDYFKRSIGTTTIEQLHNLLSPVPTAVIYVQISDYSCTFRGGFWGYQQDSVASFTTDSWDWKRAFNQLIEEGETEEKALRLIRLMIVRVHKILACCLADYHYASIDPYYSPRLPQLMKEFIQEGVSDHDLEFIVTRLDNYHQQAQEAYEERLEELVQLAEPPTLIVDSSDEQSQFKTISEAIRVAPPKSKIIVRPGLYQEGLIMNKPLEIVGEGDLNSIIIEAHDRNALLFQAREGQVANLTLRQSEGEWYGVNVIQGHLNLNGCDISSKNLACVAIGKGAYASIQDSRIHNSQKGGVWFDEGGQGLLENNDIFANVYSGVLISTESNPTLHNNKIHDNKQSGVYVYEKGLGTFESNYIFANAYNGIGIKNEGNPTLINNIIYNNKKNGVYVYEKGLGTLENNGIFGNASNGLLIKTGGNPNLINNKIYDNQKNGVYVDEKGLGTLENNDIFGNASSGIGIKTGGNSTFINNTIYDNKKFGIYVINNGLGCFERNEIFGNGYSGVIIKNGGNPSLINNKLYDHEQDGVYVCENGLGSLKDNDIFSNAYNGVEVKTGGKPTLSNNKIRDNKQSGIYLNNNGLGTFNNNNIFGNADNGVVIKTEGNPTLVNNQIHDNAPSGVYVDSNGWGTFENNDIFANTVHGVDIEGGNPTLRNNKIHDNTENGVYVHGSGLGILEKNKIFANAQYGIVIPKNYDSVLYQNNVQGNDREDLHFY